MAPILVRIKRKGASHHQNGHVYKEGEIFSMDEAAFNEYSASLPGLFERVEPTVTTPEEQIKSKDLPPSEPLSGPAKPAIQEPPDDLDGEPAKPQTAVPEPVKTGRKLELKKK